MKVNSKFFILLNVFLLFSIKLYPAMINHNPVIQVSEGKVMIIRANVIDGDSMGIMNLYVKTDFSSEYIKYVMDKRGDKYIYCYNVPLNSKFLYYYLEYKDNAVITSGSYEQPYSVKVNKTCANVMLLDPESNKTYDSDKILISISLFNARTGSVNNIKIYIDGKLFKEIKNPDQILYVYETGKLKKGKHRIELSVDNETTASHMFFVQTADKYHLYGNSTNRFSYTDFIGNQVAYSNQDTTSFNGYSNSMLSFIIGSNNLSAGFNIRMHNQYRNMLYLRYANNWGSIDIGDYSSKFIPNFVNNVVLRGVNAEIGDLYMFHGSHNIIREGSVNGTDTTFGIFREVTTGIALNNSMVKVGVLYNRDDTNSIKIGISPIENAVFNLSFSIPVKFMRFYSYNSVSITTLDSYLTDSLFDYKIGFFHINPSTISLSFSGLPFLSDISGVEFNNGIGRIKIEYFRKGGGYINTLYDRENAYENGFRYYNSFYFSGFTFTGNLEFRYPENQDIKNINIYLSKTLPMGYLFTNIIYNGSKAYYFGIISSNTQNYYYTLGGNLRIGIFNPFTAVLSVSRLRDNLNTGMNNTAISLNLYSRLPAFRGVIVSPNLQFGNSAKNGMQYSISLNTQYSINEFLLANTAGYYNIQNALYILDNIEVSYKLNDLKPSFGLYYQNNFTSSSKYSMFKTYLKLTYVF